MNGQIVCLALKIDILFPIYFPCVQSFVLNKLSIKLLFPGQFEVKLAKHKLYIYIVLQV